MASIKLDMAEMEAHLQGLITSSSPDTMLPLPDGVLSFTHRLVVELARDVLAKHHHGQITRTYLEDLHQNLETVLQQVNSTDSALNVTFTIDENYRDREFPL